MSVRSVFNECSAAAVRVVNLGLALVIVFLVLLLFSSPEWAGRDLDRVVGTSYRWGGEGVGKQNPLRHVPIAADSQVAQRGAAALAEISYPWQDRLPGWEVRFLASEEGAYGYTLTRENRIDIYVRQDQSHDLLAHVVAHEIGHAVDVTLNNGDDRSRWQDLRGIQSAPWWPDNRAADFATGAGDFAESFAAWQIGPDSFRSELASPPNKAEQALLAELATG